MTKDRQHMQAQLQALARVSGRLGTTLYLNDILELILQEAVQNTGSRGGEIVLFNARGEAELRFGSPGGVQPTPELNEEAIGGKTPVVGSAEVGAGEHMMVAPVLFEDGVTGLLRLFGGAKTHYDEAALTFASALTNHVAIAVGNARRYSELRERNTQLQRRTQQIEHFLESSRVFHSERRLTEVYEELVYAIQDGVGFNVVLLSLVEPTTQGPMLRRITAAGLPLERLEEMQRTRQPWHAVEPLLADQYRLGGAYFVPHGTGDAERTRLDIHKVSDIYPVRSEEESGGGREPWSESDLFFIPLRDSQQKFLGLISLTAPLDGLRPDLDTARALEVFANQAATAIENVQLFHNMWDYALQLQQLHNVSQQTLRERDFDRQLAFILDGLQIAGWQKITLTLRDELFNVTKLVSAGYSEEEERSLERNLLPPVVWRQRFAHSDLHEYRRGNCFFLPADEPYFRADASSVLPHPPQPISDMSWAHGGALYRPLYDRDQQFLGLLALAEPENRRQPDENGLQTIDLYAQFAISVIESQRMFGEMQRRSQQLQALFDASRALSGTLKQDAILNAMGEHMLRAVNADAYNVYALTRDRLNTVVVRSDLTSGEENGARRVGDERALVQMELAQKVIQSRRAEVSGDGDAGTPAVAMLPIPLRDELFGLVEVIAHDGRYKWDVERLQLLEAIANQAGTALETAHLVEELDDRVAQRTRALAEEVARIQSILESIADGVLVAEADGTVLMANMPTARLFNTGREQLIGKVIDELYGRYGQGIDRWSETVREWTAHAETIEQHSVVKDQFELGDRVVSVHVSPVLANGEFFGTISIFRDMTREAEVDRMKSEFISNVSHELRTPMTSIKGYADLMLMGASGELSGAQNQFLSAIRRNAERLKVLVDDLLEISWIETGKTELKLAHVDVVALIRNEVDIHLRGRLQHEQKNLDIQYELADGLAPLNADAEKITRIITNLVDNAVNYTPEGGQVIIRASESRHRDSGAPCVCVSVRDTGPGINAKNLERIFERFYRVEEESIQEAPGTGLGLSIVRNLVEMHGGEIWVESEVGQGSTFFVSLPCAPAEITEEETIVNPSL